MARIIAIVAVLIAAGAASAAPTAVPKLTIQAAAVDEGGRVTVTIRLSRPSSGRVAVRFVTSEGSAVPHVDFRPVTTVVTFVRGQQTKRIRIPTIDDSEAEDAESFVVRLVGPRNARLARSTARATIFASDLPEPFVTVAVMDGSLQASGTATLTFDAENASLRSTVSARGLGDPGGVVHLHRGGAGSEGPLLASLVGPSDNGTGTGTVPFSRALIIQIRAAPTEFYVDLHTRDGAIRGQLRRVD